MSFKIFFLIFTLILTLANAQVCKGPHEEYRLCGPSAICDPQVCRGILPDFCGEIVECIAGCFCKSGYSRYNGKCIRKCPLLP